MSLIIAEEDLWQMSVKVDLSINDVLHRAVVFTVEQLKDEHATFLVP